MTNYFKINKDAGAGDAQDTYLFFDIFYKNSQIHLIMPIYKSVFEYTDIKLTVENNLLAGPTEKYVKDAYEPTCIYKYNYTSSSLKKQIEVVVKYGDQINTYLLPHIESQSKRTLTLTTLFQNDYELFPLFYDYYVKQGVQHFYMYYNGLPTDEIRGLLKKANVTLIEWDFHYWNDLNKCKYKHHAQMGQLSHALYRYGKNENEYMIFCDLDEYMHVPNKTLHSFIKENAEIDVFGFHNIWAKTILNQYPTEFPKVFMKSGTKLRYNLRSKNIYKIYSVNIVGIHSSMHFVKAEPTAIIDLSMFHFYNWSTDKERKEDCNEVMVI
jgi:hypothetical protein